MVIPPIPPIVYAQRHGSKERTSQEERIDKEGESWFRYTVLGIVAAIAIPTLYYMRHLSIAEGNSGLHEGLANGLRALSIH